MLQEAEIDETAIAKDGMVSMDLAEEDKEHIKEMHELIDIVENAENESSLQATIDGIPEILNSMTGGLSGDLNTAANAVRTPDGSLIALISCHAPCTAEDFAAAWDNVDISREESEKLALDEFGARIRLGILSKHHHDSMFAVGLDQSGMRPQIESETHSTIRCCSDITD